MRGWNTPKLSAWMYLIIALVMTPLALAITPSPIGDGGFDDSGANLYIDGEVTFFYVSMDPADLGAILADPHSDVYRPCTVRVVNSQIDETVTDVGIRCRGNTSRDSLKKSWKLSFNTFIEGRQFHGIEKINLNGEHNDASIARSKLAWDVYRAMSVAAPRAAHAYLKINTGDDVEGAFINIEQIDEEFDENWFGDKDGNLYKCLYKGARANLSYVAPGDANAYATHGGGETYQHQQGDVDPYVDLAAFIDFLNNSDDATFAAEVTSRFNVDSFLRALAIDVCNGHWDNIWYGANNYQLYFHPDTGVCEYIPYDLDNTYGIDFFGIDWANRGWATWGNGGFGNDGTPPVLIRRILEIPAYEKQYRRYLRHLVGATGEPGTFPSQTYTDTTGDVVTTPGGPHYDIVQVVVSNDDTNLMIELQVNGPIDNGGDTGNGEYLIFFDTKSGGSTSNPWGRSINATVQHDYFIGCWPDGGGGTLLYRYDGGWSHIGSVSLDMSDKLDGIIRFSMPMSQIELIEGITFAFDVVVTGGSTSHPGVDHLSNPNPSTTSWSIPSTPGTYLSYIVEHASAPEGIAGPFTLEANEAKIDTIKAILTPYAFTGSFHHGSMDYGFTHQSFLDAYTLPLSYANNHPQDWGIKPYILARTHSLRSTVPSPGPLPAIKINEMLAYNCTINVDENGDPDDWVELFNAGDTTVDLGGMYLSDDPALPKKWQIPADTTIPSGDFLLVWCDDEPLQGPLHAEFKLSLAGEGVGLFHDDANGNVLIDYLGYPPLSGDISFGRYPDGADDTMLFDVVTPDAANDEGDGIPPEPAPTPNVFINEWMADNDFFLADEQGQFEDWFELYNAEDEPVDLGGMYLTDDLGDRTKWRIPDGTIIPAGGYLLFWADDDESDGPLHTNFKLSKSGEELGLFEGRDNCLAEVDSVTFGIQTTDISEGRLGDGTDCISILTAATPAASNTAVAGDMTNDGVVDAADYSMFSLCFGGADAPYAGTCPPCADPDFDNDGDADLEDFALFQANFGQ